MQNPSVHKLFLEQLKYYSRRDQSAGASPVISLFLEWAKTKKIKGDLKVGEFGGAAGQLLNQIGKIYPKVKLTNIEFIEGYRKHLDEVTEDFFKDKV